MRGIYALLALAAFAVPSFACINETELPQHEREFRSQYRGTGSSPVESEPNQPIAHYLGYGLGGAMIGGAIVMTLRRRA